MRWHGWLVLGRSGVAVGVSTDGRRHAERSGTCTEKLAGEGEVKDGERDRGDCSGEEERSDPAMGEVMGDWGIVSVASPAAKGSELVMILETIGISYHGACDRRFAARSVGSVIYWKPIRPDHHPRPVGLAISMLMSRRKVQGEVAPARPPAGLRFFPGLWKLSGWSSE